MKCKECDVWYIAKVDFFFPIPAVVRLEINHGNGYRGSFTVYIKAIIYI